MSTMETAIPLGSPVFRWLALIFAVAAIAATAKFIFDGDYIAAVWPVTAIIWSRTAEGLRRMVK